MLALSHDSSRMSIEDYLEWEPQQDLRYEYLNGELVAMTGGTIAHNDITLNLYRTLYSQVRSHGCRINVADVKVEVATNSSYYYPDVVVSCAPQDLNARHFIQSPTILAEVLSPGTSARDRGEKFTHYLTIPTLQEYLLIHSDKISVEKYKRGEGRMWLYYPYVAGEAIALSSLEFEFAIELLYESVAF